MMRTGLAWAYAARRVCVRRVAGVAASPTTRSPLSSLAMHRNVVAVEHAHGSALERAMGAWAPGQIRTMTTEAERSRLDIVLHLAGSGVSLDNLRGPIDELRAEGLLSHAPACNRILGRFAARGDQRSAVEFVQWMEHAGIAPTTLSYTHVLESMRTAPRPTVGHSVLRALEARNMLISPALHGRILALHASANDEEGLFAHAATVTRAGLPLHVYGMASALLMRRRQRNTAAGVVGAEDLAVDALALEELKRGESEDGDVGAPAGKVEQVERMEQVERVGEPALFDSLLARCLQEETASRAAVVTESSPMAAIHDDARWMVTRLRSIGALDDARNDHAIVAAFASVRDARGAQRVHDELLGMRGGQVHGPVTSALANAYAMVGEAQRALKIVRSATNAGAEITPPTFLAIAGALEQKGDFAALTKLIYLLVARSKEAAGSADNRTVLAVATMALKLCGRTYSHWSQAALVIERLERAHIPLDRFAYNALASIRAKQRSIQGVRAIMAQMSERGVPPSTDTYNILLEAHIGIGARISDVAVAQVFAEMESLGIPKRVGTYKTALRVAAYAGNDSIIEAIFGAVQSAGFAVTPEERMHVLMRSAIVRKDSASVQRLIATELPKVNMKKCNVASMVCRFLADQATAPGADQDAALEQALMWINLVRSQGVPLMREDLSHLFSAFAPAVAIEAPNGQGREAKGSKDVSSGEFDRQLAIVERIVGAVDVHSSKDAVAAVDEALSQLAILHVRAHNMPAARRLETLLVMCGGQPTWQYLRTAVSEGMRSAILRSRSRSRATETAGEAAELDALLANLQALAACATAEKGIITTLATLPTPVSWDTAVDALLHDGAPLFRVVAMADLLPAGVHIHGAVTHLVGSACRLHGFDGGLTVLSRLHARGFTTEPASYQPLATLAKNTDQLELVMSMLDDTRSAIAKKLNAKRNAQSYPGNNVSDGPGTDLSSHSESGVRHVRKEVVQLPANVTSPLLLSLTSACQRLRAVSAAARVARIIHDDGIAIDLRAATALVSLLRTSNSPEHADAVSWVVSNATSIDAVLVRLTLVSFLRCGRADLGPPVVLRCLRLKTPLRDRELQMASELIFQLMPPFGSASTPGGASDSTSYLTCVDIYNSAVANGVTCLPDVAANAVTVLVRAGALAEAHRIYNQFLTPSEQSRVHSAAVAQIEAAQLSSAPTVHSPTEF